VTTFRYRAARADGERIAGTVTATSAMTAAADLTGHGLFPLEVREVLPDSGGRRFHGEELAPVLSGMAALLGAGLPVDRALQAASETAGPRLEPVLRAARDAVRQGGSLSAALSASTRFPAMVIGLIRAGERSGRLAAAVERAAEELERAGELRAQVRAALTYPVFLATSGVVAVAAIVGFVMPRFATILGDLGQALPLSTRLLLGVSGAVRGHVALLLLALAAGGIAFAVAARTPAFNLAWHRWLLDAPVVGAIRRGMSSARVCRTLAGLLDAGVPLLAALEAAREASGDPAEAERVTAARREVNEGTRLATALQRNAALPPSALRLVAFGEQSGRLPAFLEQAARMDERAAHRSLRALVALIEPVLIVGFGALVAFVAAALLQAVYSVHPAGF
jgi:general secretion pathway protein F